ncbi:MAG: hypothetical protein HZA84_05260 [Thaumarchaeota archaeon]|nr:hypothetical protein [Nitrososphaerota archaeon]
MVQKSSTSLNVDPEIWKQAKIEAINKGMTLTELVEKAIESWIEKNRKRN